MLGTIVNTLAIIMGGGLGLMLRGGIPRQKSKTVIYAIGLAVVLIGLKGALHAKDILPVIIFLAVGSALGEWLRIEDGLNYSGKWLEKRISSADGNLAKGFINASLLFCVGSMAIVGSLESGISDNHQTLYAKSVLDGIASIFFASTFGVGVLFSAVSVLLYQGIITMTASFMASFLTPEVIGQMSAIGGLLILAIGLNLLEATHMRVGNMVPAIFLPLVYDLLKNIWR